MPEYDEYTQNLLNEIQHSAIRCYNCNVCFTQCPLNKSMEGFMTNGPSGLAQSILYAVKWDLFSGKEKDEILNLLYSCTTCNSCVLTCKEISTGIPVLNIIENGRKILAEKNIGPLPSQRGALKSIYTKGNPYTQAPEDRLNWLGDIEVKKLPAQESDLLYYVGCTPSYEPELQKVAIAMVNMFKALGEDFGILKNESCCGCAAKRLGDDYLFEEITEKNKKIFDNSKAKTIITTSPHCYNAFKNEYGNLSNFKIQHYVEFLADYMNNKGFNFKKELNCTVTYHDPCYLGKHNGIYEEPRAVIKSIPGVNLVEMKLNRKESLCCGGGGGRMWAEIDEEKRLANMRVEQAMAVGADVIAVACPWCHTMLKNAVRDLQLEDKIQVKDICELLLEALS